MALVILSLITSLFSTTPLRVENDLNNTDYKWEQSSVWMKMSEGISFGRIDEEGFNNLNEVNNPDVLILGSSHIEAMNVNQTESTVTVLSNKLNGKYSVYNMGISGHTFYKVCQYLPQSIKAFEKKPKYIVIETDSIYLDEENVNAAITGNIEKTKVYDKGLIAKLQRIPAFRLFYHQYDSGLDKLLFPPKTSSTSSVSSNSADYESTTTIDHAPYEKMLSYLKGIQDSSGTKLIVMYHPFETLNKDGSISFNNTYTSTFADIAEEYDIEFVDMTSDFEKMYYEEHHVPHGFSTGEIGAGHLNKYGHQAIAERLYQTILKSEE